MDEPEDESVKDNPLFAKPELSRGGYWLVGHADTTKRNKMSVPMQVVTGAVLYGPLYLIPAMYLLMHRWLTAALWGALIWVIGLVLIMTVLGPRWMGGGMPKSPKPPNP
jgi:hypothetical protein